MGLQDTWELLEVNGGIDQGEILFSYIEEYVMGSIEEQGTMKIFIKSGYKDEIINIINTLNQNFDLKWSSIENQDWHLMWKNNFTSIEINKMIKILPDWESQNHTKENTIFIKPGMSFGTGHHGTTNLMIQSIIKNREDNSSLLDLGSGSGILSIAANKLGFQKITAVENDLVCKEDIEYNFKINDCDAVDVYFDDVLNWFDFDYDLVLANIEKNIIKNIIKNINKTDARFIFSGLLKEDKKEMIAYLHENSFSIDGVESKDEWISIDCMKNEK